MTPLDIAAWMVSELERDGLLEHQTVVYAIEKKFGGEFTPLNENGNPSIRRDVLNAFSKLSSETVVWEREERLWRKRDKFDAPGRQQS